MSLLRLVLVVQLAEAVAKLMHHGLHLTPADDRSATAACAQHAIAHEHNRLAVMLGNLGQHALHLAVIHTHMAGKGARGVRAQRCVVIASEAVDAVLRRNQDGAAQVQVVRVLAHDLVTQQHRGRIAGEIVKVLQALELPAIAHPHDVKPIGRRSGLLDPIPPQKGTRLRASLAQGSFGSARVLARELLVGRARLRIALAARIALGRFDQLAGFLVRRRGAQQEPHPGPHGSAFRQQIRQLEDRGLLLALHLLHALDAQFFQTLEHFLHQAFGRTRPGGHADAGRTD